MYNIHVKPNDVQQELSNLEEAIEDDGNIVVIGDLNADCRYYDAEEEKEFDSWHWMILDYVDTTMSNSDCAYDRILLNDDMRKEFVIAREYGIEKGITLLVIIR